MKTGLLALSLLSLAASQDPIHDTAMAQMNGQIASFWADPGAGMIAEKITQALESIKDLSYKKGRATIKIYYVENIHIHIEPAPGFEQLSLSRIQVRLPLQGEWEIRFRAKVRVKYKVGFITISDTFKLDVKIKHVWVRACADLDASDPEAPRISDIAPPEIHFELHLSTNKWYLNILLDLFEPLIQKKLHETVGNALEALRPALEAFQGKPEPFGTGGPGVPPVDSFDYETPALKISQKIGQCHLPYHGLVGARFGTPYFGTWEESWNYDPGPPAWHTEFGDSAIWSGHALAAEAFRCKVTGDPAAKQQAGVLLDGITQMVHMRGIPGLLNRAVVPISVSGPPESPNYAVMWNGEPHLAYDSISRDQYMGVFFGLATAYDMIDDPEIREGCRKNIEAMLDYLLANRWIARTSGGSISTTWQMNFVQQLAWIQAGRRVAPAKYAGAYAEHAYLADLCWFGTWMETFDPIGSYFKFNLEHGSYFTLLRLDSNAESWSRIYKGFRILRRALSHHLQAHFNVCEAGVAPWRNAELGPETRSLLRYFLQRPRRRVASQVTGVETTIVMDDGKAVEVAKVPLPPQKRPSTDFLWQRDPFRLSTSGDGMSESPGVDYILPYWMARFYGVFP